MNTKKYIAILAPVGISIPPKRQGAIEWMVYFLAEGLVKKGYPVLLFAPKGTKTSAKLVSVFPKTIGEYRKKEGDEVSRKLRLELTALSNAKAELLKRKSQIGLVFNHVVDGGMFGSLEKEIEAPVFHVTHLPLYQELASLYKKHNSRLIAISQNQKKLFSKLRYSPVIYNGVDLKKINFSKKTKDYFLFAGKMTPSKNPLDAILAAKKTGEKLILAGKASDKDYFDDKIKPLIDGEQIKYLGEITFLNLLKLYSKAKGFLFPVRCEEAFGLVMIEAMASGTPVIAYPRGSVREVVKNKETGFIVKNVNEMAEAIKKIDQIKRRDCRKHVEENFSIERMIKEYERVCLKILI